MSGYFVFNGADSRNYGIKLYHRYVDNAPAQIYNSVSIAGRNGELLTPQERYPNIEHSYSGVIYQDVDMNLTQLRSLLASSTGYVRLEDSFNPDEFYQAAFKADLEVMRSANRNKCKFVLPFWRKPQRWLKSGEQEVTVNNSDTTTVTYNNPTPYASKPLLVITKATGATTSTLQIGSITITINWGNFTLMRIDCETMNAYNNANNYNRYITLNSLYFPTFEPGNNNIVIGTGISKLVYTPRTFRL